MAESPSEKTQQILEEIEATFGMVVTFRIKWRKIFRVIWRNTL